MAHDIRLNPENQSLKIKKEIVEDAKEENLRIVEDLNKYKFNAPKSCS